MRPRQVPPSFVRRNPSAPPFLIGRQRELAAVHAGLESTGLVIVLGEPGVGKTELGRAVAADCGRTVAWISCERDDTLAAVRGRIARLGASLVVLDDVHRLGLNAEALLEGLSGRWVVALSEDRLPLQRATEVALAALTLDEARALWRRLEEDFGSTSQAACDLALATSRLPRAIRRAYARALLDLEDPWDLEGLAPDERRVLEALAVLGRGSAAAVAALTGIPSEEPLRLLAERQLVTPDGHGFVVDRIMAGAVLAALPDHERSRYERTAAQQVGGDICDRLLAAARHLLTAGVAEAAVELLGSEEQLLVGRGAGPEVCALLERVPLKMAYPLHIRILVATGNIGAARALAERAGSGGAALRLAVAEAAFAAGELQVARARLEPIADGAAAQSLAARIDLERGHVDAARARAVDRWLLDEIDARDLGVSAAGERLLSMARIAEAVVESSAPAAPDEQRRRQAVTLARAGRLVEAEKLLGELGRDARRRGAELAALRAEIELARVLANRGRLYAAAQLAAELVAEAGRRGLELIASEAALLLAEADLDAQRLPEAERAAAALDIAATSQRVRQGARRVVARARAARGCEISVPDSWTCLEDGLVAAEIAQHGGQPDVALTILERVAAQAERADRRVELAAALAEMGRLMHAYGDRSAAGAAAARALTEASASGADRTVVRALLVTAALARAEGDLTRARAAIADALVIARSAALGIERYAAAAAGDTLARLAQDRAGAEILATMASAASATLTAAATAAAERFLADLGLSPSCAYRLIAADGGVSYSAKLDAVRLGLDRKALVVDGEGEVVLRHGQRIAELRRRTLLKRLLFLFAGAPGRLFSKEEIVERIWGVEYHPLHHDAALFTNVMRTRRLLGPGGADLLRVGEGGYQLVPPPDFLFIEKLPG